MACLLETAADVIAVLVHSGTKACIDAADDPGPIVRAGCRSIDKVAIRKHGRWQHPCLEGAIFVVAELGGTDRRRTGDRSEERRVGKECVSPCKSPWSPYH